MSEINQAQMMRFANRPMTIRELAEQSFEIQQSNMRAKHSDDIAMLNNNLIHPSFMETPVQGSIPMRANADLSITADVDTTEEEHIEEETEEETESVSVTASISPKNVVFGFGVLILLIAAYLLMG